MRFFDLVAVKDDSLDALAGRLGFKRMFCVGKDVEIIESLGKSGKAKKIVRSDNIEVLAKSLRENDIIGALPCNSSISKKTLELIKSDEKVLFIPLSIAVCCDEASRIQKLARTRSLIRSALMSKVIISLISLAEEKECLLSSAQMIEVANFLGIDQRMAKDALGVLGDLL